MTRKKKKVYRRVWKQKTVRKVYRKVPDEEKKGDIKKTRHTKRKVIKHRATAFFSFKNRL